MNIVSLSHPKKSGNDGGHCPVARLHSLLPRIAESFWLSLCFILFLLLGPFSAIVVLAGLGSLASEENRERMQEPARL